ncbi:MAG: CGNR zinc finger domain-containing protein [Acidobacteria bacterium]|nr:CGNR zinc finger domain-containing protein [Acidobacteriota bacterium]
MEWLRGPAWIDNDRIVFDTTRATTYQPLTEPQLGIELARVHTEDEVVAFVRRYGLLQSKPEPTNVDGLLHEVVIFFLMNAYAVAGVLEWAVRLRQAAGGDSTALSELRKGKTIPPESRYPIHKGGGLDTMARADRLWVPDERLVDADDRTVLMRSSERMAAYLNALLRGEDAGIQFVDRAAMGEDAPPTRWRLGMMPSTLLGACYLSVALTLVDQKPIGICAEPSCRRIYFIDDGRQRFCTATCANRARFKRYKERHGGAAKVPKEGNDG